MSVFQNIGGVLYVLHGIVTATPVDPPETPVRDNMPILPVMGSASQDGYIITQSTFYSESGVSAEGWKLRNGIYSNDWRDGASTALNASAPHWWRFKLPAPKWIFSLDFRARTDAPQLLPPGFKIQDMKTGTPVDMLDTGETPLPWANGQTALDITTPLFTDDFRIYVGSHSGVLCQLAEVQFGS